MRQTQGVERFVIKATKGREITVRQAIVAQPRSRSRTSGPGSHIGQVRATIVGANRRHTVTKELGAQAGHKDESQQPYVRHDRPGECEARAKDELPE